MAGRIDTYLERLRLRKVQRLWSRLAGEVPQMDLMDLRQWRTQARTMRHDIDRVIQAADARLSLPVAGDGEPRPPLGTDWVWRPDLWRGPLAGAGAVADVAKTALSDDVTVFHDCTAPELILRQARNHTARDGAPFGLTVEAFGFDGSFVSVATRLPQASVDGLRMRHLIRVEVVLDADLPVTAFARLNIKHGPNVEPLVRDLPRDGREKVVEFDLAYSKIDEKRVERMWLDLIFQRPAMNRITVRDLTVSRRPRAEL